MILHAFALMIIPSTEGNVARTPIKNIAEYVARLQSIIPLAVNVAWVERSLTMDYVAREDSIILIINVANLMIQIMTEYVVEVETGL